MLLKALIVLLSVQLILARPQFITFKDGKIGVNFGGYHAEAGLGGLLTGNAAHGGLSASAGTPFGQKAGAGVGGSVDGAGRTAGGAYAGATSGHGAGASASIGGSVDGQSGSAGGQQAEAHALGKSKSVVKLYESPVASAPLPPALVVDEAQPQLDTRTGNEIVVKKTVIKKKYVPEVAKPVVYQDAPPAPVEPAAAPTPGYQAFDYTKFFDFSFFGNLANQFGGNPQGFQVQKQAQQQPQDGLISYTVQKQFAPVKYTPQEQPQSIQPAVAGQLLAGNVDATGDGQAGFEKTIKKRSVITLLTLDSPESKESAELERLGLKPVSLESQESLEKKRLGLKSTSVESKESIERKRLGLPDLSIESHESVDDLRRLLKAAVSLESAESAEQKRLGLKPISLESAESAEQKRLGLKPISLESKESAERKRLGLPDLSLESVESNERKRLGLKTSSLESIESAERKRLGLKPISLESKESAERKRLGLPDLSLESVLSNERKRLGLKPISLESAESAERKRLGLPDLSLESIELKKVPVSLKKGIPVPKKAYVAIQSAKTAPKQALKKLVLVEAPLVVDHRK